MDQIYNSYFFTDFYEKNGGGNYEEKEQWMPFFYGIADEIIKRYNPKTVLDAGCAMGYLVEALRDRGVEAYGIDISEYAIHAVRKDIRPFCAVNSITESIPYTFPQKFDLIITIEVLEHLFPEDSAIAIANLCQYTDMIIFSSTPSDIEDRTHVNVQQREYWARIFAKNNFYRELSQPMEFISPWAMVFVKKHDIEKIIFDYEMHLRINELEKKKLATEENNKARENGEVFENQLQIFYDYGNGFSEENSIKIPYEGLNFSTSVAIPEKVVAVRIDPAEGIFCAVIDFKAETECENCCVQTKDAEQIDNTYIFYTKDPQFIIERQNVKYDKLVISGTVLNRESEEEKVLFQVLRDTNLRSIQKLKEKEIETKSLIEEYTQRQEKKDEIIQNLLEQQETFKQQLEHYTLHYQAAINQREELKNQLVQAQVRYDTISNATCWKLTAPLRWILDGTKQILKKNRYTYLFCKGLKCLKQNGVVYTWNKVKGWRKYRLNFQNALQPLYSKTELEAQKHYKFSKNIKFSILVPLYNTPERFLREMIESVQAQTYGNWELCMADGSDENHKDVEKICKLYVKKDKRVKYRKLEKNYGISGNTNACIEMATGEYIGLFDHDDILHPAALYENMKVICGQKADFIYTDENTFHNKPEDAYCPHFKPDYAPDTLRTNNYICHFTVFKRSLLDIVGEFRSCCDGSQDYDMVLRLTEQAKKIVHIPKILYYWRAHHGSVATDVAAKPYVIEAAHKALSDHLERIHLEGKVLDTSVPSMYRIKYMLKEESLVSIIIPNKDHVDDLKKCIDSIITTTTYENYEIIVVENNSTKERTWEYYQKIKALSNVKVVIWDEKHFNYSAINNYGAQFVQGKYIVLLNNDTEIISGDWLQEMLMFVQRNDVGAVGAKLYYPDDTIQHAGLGIGLLTLAGHYHRNFPRNHPGYMGRLIYAHNVSAVTAACMMIPQSVWNEMNGLDESFEVAFNDVDLCMRIRKAGYLIVWTPYAELYHYESKSRGLEDTPEKQKRFEGEVKRFQERWAKELQAGDPYYNPNFTLDREDFSLK